MSDWRDENRESHWGDKGRDYSRISDGRRFHRRGERREKRKLDVQQLISGFQVISDPERTQKFERTIPRARKSDDRPTKSNLISLEGKMSKFENWSDHQGLNTLENNPVSSGMRRAESRSIILRYLLDLNLPRASVLTQLCSSKVSLWSPRIPELLRSTT